MTEERVDVVVVGAGPAGSMAALASARHGARTVLVERHDVVGVPVRCAEFVPAMLLIELSRQGVDASGSVAQATGGLVMHLPGGQTRRIRAPGAVLSRSVFDRELARHAVLAGARLDVSSPAVQVDPDEGMVIIGGGRPGSIRAAIVVAADGPISLTARSAGLGRPELMLARQVVAQLRDPVADAHLWFGSGYRYGYGWLFPKGRLANVGVAVQWGRPDLARTALGSLVSQLVLLGLIEDPAVRGGAGLGGSWGFVPAGGPLGSTWRGAVLAAGDSAGQVDPVTGAGIMWAVRCGYMAGRAAALGSRGAPAAGACGHPGTAAAISSLRAQAGMSYENAWRSSCGRHFDRALGRRDRMRTLWDEDIEAAIASAWIERSKGSR